MNTRIAVFMCRTADLTQGAECLPQKGTATIDRPAPHLYADSGLLPFPHRAQLTEASHAVTTSPSFSQSGAPPILTSAADLLSRYDVLFCDVWGVVHNGLVAYDEACQALQTFRARGGTVVLVSNAPVPKARVIATLGLRKVPRDAYDDVVSSGDLALAHVRGRAFHRLYGIGPQDRDAALFRELADLTDKLDDADAIICTGLNDDRREVPDDYLPLLERAKALNLPFVCANPDFVVDVGGTIYYCAGAIADLYTHIGGDVFWAGKPYLNAYEAAHAVAEAKRNGNVAREKILVIGDALRTDIKGAENFGCDALFVASGIHRHDAMDGDRLSAEKLVKLFSADAPRAVAAMAGLRL